MVSVYISLWTNNKILWMTNRQELQNCNAETRLVKENLELTALQKDAGL